ncbi:MAG: multidrug resistance efflux pump [Vicingaceae bacterium]|jgi:multidrug resistance efflux pump
MKIDEIENSSEQIREILEKPPSNILRWGITVIFLIICLVSFGTWLIKYPDVILSQVVVTSLIPPQKEYAKTTGKLQVVLVEDGDIVQENQALAVIENTANYMDVVRLQTTIDSIVINNANFQFPIDSLPLLFLGDVEPYYSIFENSYSQYKLNQELEPFLIEGIAHNNSINELNQRLKSLQNQKSIFKTELEFKRKTLLRNKTLFDKGVIAAQTFENIQLDFAQVERNLKNFEVSISQVKELTGNAKRNSKGTLINKRKEEIALLKSVIQSFNQLKIGIRDWEQKYLLKSQMKGNVSFLNFWNENQSVKQGDLVFTIIPVENSSLIAKLKAPLQNSGRIKKGQKVFIKLVNYPFQEFGVLEGEINSISLTTDENGMYNINVLLPQKLITSYNKEIEFKQEMSGVAEIVTEDLRLIERFFYEFKKIFST